MSKNAENHYTNENSYMHKWFLKSFFGEDLFKKHSSLKKWFLWQLFHGSAFCRVNFMGYSANKILVIEKEIL